MTVRPTSADDYVIDPENKDDRGTPWDMFRKLNRRFSFTVDAAAAPHNAKLPRFWTQRDDSLSLSWAGERVWCNPPYSNIYPWARKALSREHELAVLLVPATRTEQAWWQDHIERPQRAKAPWLSIEFLGPGRFNFCRPGEQVPMKGSPRFGCCLIIVQGRRPRSNHPGPQWHQTEMPF